MTNQIDIAWLAGIFEGEGCISIPKGDSYPLLTVNMSDKDIIERLQVVTGVGTICGVARSTVVAHHKDLYKWSVSKREDVVRVLLMITPLMGERRRAKISEAAERLSRPRKIRLVALCGTISGRDKHRRLKESICDSCRLAANEYNKLYRRQVRAARK